MSASSLYQQLPCRHSFLPQQEVARNSLSFSLQYAAHDSVCSMRAWLLQFTIPLQVIS